MLTGSIGRDIRDQERPYDPCISRASRLLGGYPTSKTVSGSIPLNLDVRIHGSVVVKQRKEDEYLGAVDGCEESDYEDRVDQVGGSTTEVRDDGDENPGQRTPDTLNRNICQVRRVSHR